MIKVISRTKQILEKLEREGRVTNVQYDYTEFNKKMAEIRREYRRKAAMSERAASKIWLY